MPDLDRLTRAALDAAARGWHVFPLAPDTKRPAVTSWETRATVDPARVERCWSAGPYGIGIACGPSGLLVVDLDVPKPAGHLVTGAAGGWEHFAAVCAAAGQPVPLGTYAVRTPSGGRHLYYAHPAPSDPAGPGAVELRNTAGTLAPLVDTRGKGGYVVAAGTALAGPRSGGYVAVDHAGPVEPLPAWLVQRLTPTPIPAPRPVAVELPDRRRSAYLTAAIAREIDRVTRAPVGGRNGALFCAAVALGQLVAGDALPAQLVTDQLDHAGRAAGLTLRETTRTIASGLTVGARRPRKVAA